MIKRSLTIVAIMIFLAGTSFGQQWTLKNWFPDNANYHLKNNTGCQYDVVDKNGNIWICPYNTDGDSLFVPDSNMMKKVRPIYVFAPDGTCLDTIKSLTIGGVLYPLYGYGYGVVADDDGNIILAKGQLAYRINYKTHEGMNVVNPLGTSLLCPAVDGAGNIYFGPVVGGNPIAIFYKDFTSSGVNVIDALPEYGRVIMVSKDGNTVYAPRYSSNNTVRLRRASEFDPYIADTVLAGAATEACAWDPVDTTKLWMSMGNAGFAPAKDPWVGYDGCILMFDTTTWAHTDSMKWTLRAPGLDERLRGMAFSNDGTDCYLIEFGTSDSSCQIVNNPQHKVISGIKQVDNTVVSNYTLSQNYPNPFNPTTTINFSVVKSGNVSLKVFNMLGQEVATLVNGNLSVGSYKANFDASKLSSGIYIYQLNAGNVSISKKMTLLK